MHSIGERLEEARKRKGITVREASEATKIRGEYLNNFEANSFKMNLPDIYVRGFLRSYANYLKVNSDKVITDYNAHLIGEGKSSRRDAREFLGRLELQEQPLVAEGAQNPGSVEDSAIESTSETSESIPIWERFNMEQGVAIKIGIVAGLALILIIAVIWAFLTFMESSDPAPDTNLTETPAVIAPEANAAAFTLIANDDVRVEIKQVERNIPLFFAVLPAGQEKELSASGSVRIHYSDANALSIRIGSKTYKMQTDRSSIRITPANILKQQKAGN